MSDDDTTSPALRLLAQLQAEYAAATEDDNEETDPDLDVEPGDEEEHAADDDEEEQAADDDVESPAMRLLRQLQAAFIGGDGSDATGCTDDAFVLHHRSRFYTLGAVSSSPTPILARMYNQCVTCPAGALQLEENF